MNLKEETLFCLLCLKIVHQEQQEEEVEASVVNAKKGDENNTYDEEALAIQRRYREIPEDVGGLLREFIKKEYMKDRYRDENN